MDSTVRRCRNHYETLGLKVTAGDPESKETFARAMRLPHPPVELVQIGIAFDTLSNCPKRRAYDEALGLIIPEPQPRVAPRSISVQISGNFRGPRPTSLDQP